METEARRRTFSRQLRSGEKALTAQCPLLGAWICTAGKSQWEVAWQRELYESLILAIAHQQLHGNAARAILKRFQAGFRGSEFPSPQRVARAGSEKLRPMGFSTAKGTAIQGIAAAAKSGQIPGERLRRGQTRVSGLTGIGSFGLMTRLERNSPC